MEVEQKLELARKERWKKREEKGKEGEEQKKERETELERTRIEVQRGKFQQGRGEGRVESTKSQISKSLKLVPAFDKEKKTTEFFQRFEKKTHKFEWPRKR